MYIALGSFHSWVRVSNRPQLNAAVKRTAPFRDASSAAKLPHLMRCDAMRCQLKQHSSCILFRPSQPTKRHERRTALVSDALHVTVPYLWRVGHCLEVADVANLLRQARLRLDGEEYQRWGAALRLCQVGLSLGDWQQGILHLFCETREKHPRNSRSPRWSSGLTWSSKRT